MAKKKAEAHHGGAWKVAYADFVTAMMALFMVLWICAQDKKILIATSKYFKQPFNAVKENAVGIMPKSEGGTKGKDHAADTTTAANLALLNSLAAEFNRMIKASITYAMANRDEVFNDLAKQANIDRGFFDWWFDRTTEVPGYFSDTHAAAVTKAWEIGKSFGMIQAVPDVRPLIWDQTLRS